MIRLTRLFHARLVVALLATLPLLMACAPLRAFWVQQEQPSQTPTATPELAAPTLAATRVRPSPTPPPTQTEGEGEAPHRLDFSGDAIQYWSNPNSIHDLVFDGESLWAATYGGLVQWRGEGDYRIYTVRDGLASQAVAALAMDAGGRLWVGYEDVDGWTMREGDGWRHWNTRRQAVEANHAALLGAQRTHPRLWATRPQSAWIWLPRGDGAIQAYDGQRWRAYGAESGVTADSRWIGVSAQGRAWAVGQGVSTTQEGELYWDYHTFFSDVTNAADVTGVAVDAQGALWIGFANHAGGGLTRYNPELQRWEGHLAEINPAIPAQVHVVSVDPDGTLWVGGQGRLSLRPPLRRFATFELGDVRVLAFARDGTGHIWLGSDQGLYRLHTETKELVGPWTIPSPLPDNQITGLALNAEGIVYVGTPRGISWIDAQGETGTLTEQGVLWLGADAAGGLWAATREGFGRLEGDGAISLVYTQGPVAAAVLGPDGTAHLVTPEGLLLRVGGQGTEELADVLSWTGAMPRDLAVDSRGTVWLATAVGLAQRDADGTRSIHTGDGNLLSQDVRDVAVDVDDTLWVATARGLARRRADGRWTRMTTESTGGGLRSMEMRGVSVGLSGDLWMATRNGISRREPTESDWSFIDVPGALQVLEDGRGGLWVATRAGLYRIAADALTLVE